jgi:hypothetical protein
MALPTRRSTLRAVSGPFAIPSKGGSARGYDRVYNSYGEPRFGPDARYLRRSRVILRSPETLYPMQTGPSRREQYWGGGFFSGYRYGD